MVDQLKTISERVSATIRRERLLCPGSRTAVGVSGGADSVALLLILHQLAPAWKLELLVAHANHGWRGAESDADEAFVVALAARLGLPFRAARLEIPAKNREAGARVARYRFLFETARDFGAAAVAVGHHADDAAETFFINLLRGAGPDGLSGITACRPAPGFPGINLVRPLIALTREDLRRYLSRAGQDFREDSSNLDPSLARNRIRGELLPLLKSLHPGASEAVVRAAGILREESAALRETVEQWISQNSRAENDRFGIRLSDYPNLPPGFRMVVLRQALRRMDPGLLRITRGHLRDLDRLARCPDHGRLNLPAISAVKVYDFLEFRPAAASSRREPFPEQQVGLPVPGEAEWEGLDGPLLVRAELLTEVSGAPDPATGALLDAGSIKGGLKVRTRRPGDRYRPMGMEGRRRLKEVMNELRLPPRARDRWPLIADDSEILWVPGMRPAERARTAPDRPAVRVTVRRK